ncbi:MAG: Hpt domain-containing protein [Bacteroidia bacterium]|nr:Hpt domain-containing protein [Bacteroidia bacterium]
MHKPALNINMEYSYDLSQLIQLSHGSKDFVANMLEIFIKSAGEIMAQLKGALVVDDWNKVSELSHKAIPSFHFMGLINFSDELRYIEQNAKKEIEHARIHELIGFIDKNMVVILKDLKEEAEKYKT